MGRRRARRWNPSAARSRGDVPRARAPPVTPSDIPLTVAYEDDDLAVVDKPAGLVVHPAPGHWEGRW